MDDWVKHFSKLLTSEEKNPFEHNLGDIDELSPLDFPFSCKEVRLGIKNLRNGKSCGPDLVLNEFIKTSSNLLLPTLVKLFNKILNVGKIPQAWNQSFITVLHKSGDPNNCNNYRGLSVNSCLGKLFSGLLQTRLSNYLENNSLLSPFQSGFRKQRRTTDNIFVLKTLINKYAYCNKTKLYTCFVDFKKAFDTVWRPALLHKLLNKGIGGNFYRVIDHVYSTTVCAVKQSHVQSNFFSTNRGVKQGDNLSPTLFNIFIDDFTEYLDISKTSPVKLNNIQFNSLFFADDLLLVSESADGLQHCLDALEKYCCDWKLEVNTHKTNAMVFSSKKTTEMTCKIRYKEDIEFVDEYKYLGVVLKNNGKLKFACENLAVRARKAYFSIKSKLPNNANLSGKVQFKIYELCIIPILTYASEIWISDYKQMTKGFDKTPFEKIQNFILKDILGVHSKSSNLAVRIEFGALPIIFKIYKLLYRYYYRLQKNVVDKVDPNLLLQHAYIEDENLAENGKTCWQHCIQKILDDIIGSNNTIPVKDFENNLKKYFENIVFRDLENIKEKGNGKLSFYSQLIISQNLNKLEIQPYLNFSISKMLRSFLTKLRISAHKLQIEVGRYCNPIIPRDERYCISCQTVVEDEHHFLFECPLYNQLRSEYCTLFNNDCDMSFEILTPSDVKSTRNICHFIREALNIRK